MPTRPMPSCACASGSPATGWPITRACIALVHADPRGLRAAAARRDLAAPGAPAASPTLAQALLQRHPRYVERRLPPGAGAVHSGRTPR